LSKQLDLVVIGHVGFENINTDSGVVKYLGGAGYHTSLAGSLFSDNIGLVARVGSDIGQGKLESLGINLAGVKFVEGISPVFRLRYNPENYEERDFEVDLNVAENLGPKDIPEEYFAAKYIHIATAPPQKQIKLIEYIRGKSDAKLSIDSLEQFIEESKSDVLKAFSLVDIIFVNRREAELIGAFRDSKIMVIKKGADGAAYMVNGKILCSVLAPQAKVVDPTGSGDILAGVLLTKMAQTDNFEKSLKVAVKTASKAVERFGPDFLLEEMGEYDGVANLE